MSRVERKQRDRSLTLSPREPDHRNITLARLHDLTGNELRSVRLALEGLLQ